MSLSSTGRITVEGSGALLLSGVIVNLICGAAVLTIQYAADPNSTVRILRWMIGSLDVIGFQVYLENGFLRVAETLVKYRAIHRQAGLDIRAGEVDGAGVARGGVAECVLSDDRHAQTGARGCGGRRRDHELTRRT